MTATTDGFTRSVDRIDHDLHEQVQRRDAGLDEILHGIFVAERATLAIDRLIEERLRAKRSATPAPTPQPH